MEVDEPGPILIQSDNSKQEQSSQTPLTESDEDIASQMETESPTLADTSQTSQTLADTQETVSSQTLADTSQTSPTLADTQETTLADTSLLSQSGEASQTTTQTLEETLEETVPRGRKRFMPDEPPKRYKKVCPMPGCYSKQQIKLSNHLIAMHPELSVEERKEQLKLALRYVPDGRSGVRQSGHYSLDSYFHPPEEEEVEEVNPILPICDRANENGP
ncbi:uncharacterized protein LOC135337260 isoform X2 [Halichondria panicea]|uniref:uncharacterized protein LOC135337260 isoform X2 n=1 Tax=Halichondria panicea TaxID=6063 RepID=UPI00312BCA0C